MTEAVLEALRAMRAPFAPYEADLHTLVALHLRARGFTLAHEATLGQGNRIDFLIDGVGVEIKKGKPRPTVLIAQLERYAKSDRIDSLVVISWQSVTLPAHIGGKPVFSLALGKLWGVSLP